MERSVFLYMTAGKSNKQYNVHLKQDGEGWVVNFENGPRGRNLRTGTKTTSPVDLQTANKTFDALVAKKQKGGYTADESGQAYVGTEYADSVTGFEPQLLNEITEEDAIELGATGHWFTQTKHDGERRGVRKDSSCFVYSNRRGMGTAVSQPVHDAFEALARTGLGEFEFDCESMGNHIVIFDVLSLDGEDQRKRPFKERAEVLHMMHNLTLRADLDATIKVDVPSPALTKQDVISRIEMARKAGEEGLTFKDGREPYTPDRPASGGPALKLKFWESATVRIAKKHATKRSVSLEVLDGEAWIDVGNCTIPSNHDIPAQGDLVEIEYLYAYKGGSLFQPKYRGIRTDLEVSDANVGQLKYFQDKKTA